MAEYQRQRDEAERRQRVMVITEFDAGDPKAILHALADEFLKYRRAETSTTRSSAKVRSRKCAGLMAVLAREGCTNTIMQVAERYGCLEPSRLDPREEAYASWGRCARSPRPQ